MNEVVIESARATETAASYITCFIGSRAFTLRQISIRELRPLVCSDALREKAAQVLGERFEQWLDKEIPRLASKPDAVPIVLLAALSDKHGDEFPTVDHVIERFRGLVELDKAVRWILID